MKILMILGSNFPTDNRVEKEFRSLVESGHSVDLLCFRFNRKIPKQEEYKGINIYRIYLHKSLRNMLYVTSARIPILSILVKYKINYLYSKTNYDILHIHDLPLTRTGYELHKEKGIRYVSDMHENYPSMISKSKSTNTYLKRMLVDVKLWFKKEKEWLKQSSLVIATNYNMRARLNTVLDEKKDTGDIIVVENTIDINNTTIPKVDSDPNYTTLIYVGGVSYHRGIQVALQGYKIAKSKFSSLRFWIVGSGSYLPELEKLVLDSGIEDVTFWGKQDRSKTLELIAQSDVCLIPHLKYEQTDNASPNKLFEYMYARKPIFTSNCDSVVNIIEEVKCGSHYIHSSHEDFCNKLLNLLNSNNLVRMGQNGYDAVISKYNWSQSAKTLIDAYSKLKY